MVNAVRKTCVCQKRPRRVTAGVLTIVALTITAVTGIPVESACFVVAAKQPASQINRKNQQNVPCMRSTVSPVSSSTDPSTGLATFLDPLKIAEPASRKAKGRRENGKSSWPVSVAQRFGLASALPMAVTEEAEYQRRKNEWASKYTSLHSLRETFGGNENKLWGDLDARTARRLYKTLLPRALLELYNLGLRPEDLAPLAYQARVAAKLYARERCQLPPRYAAYAIDGFRQWKNYGKFQPKGMSYDQVWNKYEEQIGLELLEDDQQDLTDDDVTAKICLKILEKSCKTNEHIDKWVLNGKANEDKEESELLHAIAAQLERDVQDLLDPTPREQVSKHEGLTARRVFTLRLISRAKKRLAQIEATDASNSVKVEDKENTTTANNKAFAPSSDDSVSDKLNSSGELFGGNRQPRKLKIRRRPWREPLHRDRTK
mmetsp:Transcript_10398/g.14682  ORF Transcript_10398/g.14682 Transcript_10398/m.14682 type:complete len:432 (+) Transcript_10398:298-1593(+)